MGPDLEKAIHELSLRMRLIRAVQEDQEPEEALTERESLIFQQLAERGPMSVSQIAEAWPNVSESTISMTLTKLWKRKLVSKTISQENQRITLIDLTDQGRDELANILRQRSERFQALFNAIRLTPEEKELVIHICQRGVKYLDNVLGLEHTVINEK
ncbi:MAG: MarR family transcriptional regulator [Phycisphaerae bacterium]|nr:MarR family transcriptional regulator [Phycisphaerae bacterium]